MYRKSTPARSLPPIGYTRSEFDALAPDEESQVLGSGFVAEHFGHLCTQVGIDLAPVLADTGSYIVHEAGTVTGVTDDVREQVLPVGL